ncbi:hypothetical protein GCM10009127_13570 [Alteraurantiacibacter aestuarii]|uniref:phage baseplate assembly protein V n=1 Tax=Alteraurantiacibacter aestuarii TaxID=650004 RepID=UPI001925A64C|nr:phage baseplate assembly protein V [Alteraurantiacibacter aestuarii]
MKWLRRKKAGEERFWGKYRGKVMENKDPLFQGRIIARVPSISGSLLNWALPCVPYAGKDVGFYAIPPVGANVWIEFEGGDPDYPVWAGCFWGPEDIIHAPEPVVPELKVFKTAHTTIIINDLDEVGGYSVHCNTPAVDVPLSMVFNSEGIKLTCPEANFQMTPESITQTVPEARVSVTAARISMTVPESTLNMTPEVLSLAVPASSIELSGEAIEVEAPEVSVDGEVNMMPLVTIEGDNNVAGALTVELEANVAGAVTIEGGLAIEGGGEIDGAPIL